MTFPPRRSRIFPLILVETALSRTPGSRSSAEAMLDTPRAPCRKEGMTAFSEKLMSMARDTHEISPRVNLAGQQRDGS